MASSCGATRSIAASFRSRHFSRCGAVTLVAERLSRELSREPLDRGGEGQAELAVDAAQLVGGRRDEVLVRQVDPGRRARCPGVQHGTVALHVLMRADLLERSGAQLSPAGDEDEAPAVAVELVEARERLRQAIADEARSRAPALHQRAHVVGAAPPEEDERRVRGTAPRGTGRGGSSPGSCRRSVRRGRRAGSRGRGTRAPGSRSRSARRRPSSTRGRAGGGTRPRGCGPRSGRSRARRSRAVRRGGASSRSGGSR